MPPRIKNLFVRLALIIGLGLSCQAAHAQSCDPPPSGLVAWWPGEGNALDIVGGNNGTLEGGATYASGEVGQAFSFNGNNQFVQIADSPSLRLASFTVECWFNASNNIGQLVGKPVGSGANDSFAFGIGTGDIYANICNVSTHGPNLFYPFTPVPGDWYHVAYTFDDASKTQTLYLNGSVVVSGIANLSIGYDSHPVLIGADNDSGQTVLPFTGEIDEVSIYDRALSASEIAAIYNAGTAGKCQPGLVQLNIPSDGSDGALNVTSNIVIDLSQAVTGTWTQNNSVNAGKGVYDPTNWAVVFKYSSVNIANGATVSFLNHYGYPPVVWLVQSNVTINGTVSLNGNNGVAYAPAQYRLTEPGPGGFRGGALNTAIGFGDGLGPGGGVSTGSGATAGTYQSSYGNPQILPLIGGSGESNFRDGNNGVYSSGGAGAGAILIAASGTVSVNGQITATPGEDTGDTNSAPGAGGGIRMIASQIAGTGTITATPQGRTRMEAYSISSQLNITPNVSLVLPGTTPIIFPPTSSPTVSIVSVGGQSAPADSAANVISSPDFGISTNSQVTVVLQTKNFPTTGSVAVRVVPVYGPSSVLNANYVSGNSASAIWQLTASIPVGYCVLQPRATAP